MTIIVTGAAGFIGSNLVKGLNERGETNIVAVDNLTRAEKFGNLVDCEIADYLDKSEFVQRFARGTSARFARCSMRARAPTPWRPTAAT